MEKVTHEKHFLKGENERDPGALDVSFYNDCQENSLFTPLKNGFEWGTGDNTITNGIWMWSRPFLLLDIDDVEIAVLVFDTPGLNASHVGNNNKKIWDPIVDAQIFSITSLLSSVQVRILF